MAWEIELVAEVEAWFLDLCHEEPETADLVQAAIDVLEREGPTLGRPLADRITGSEIHNLKELRPGSAGESEVRMLFVFDPRRCAVLLVAGDKQGRWTEWYREAIPLAEQRYTRHMTAVEDGDDG
ncbi:MAG TPA: type II toxin-antitoxin system RelE/ParE family toxin [Pseudonocardiaceae bacterium]|nr:type II toxin-antitoxin system RelE/ParE family toxin [Pseudonocardiaceae bacterium]